jgi:hypothetical protein
MPTSAKYEKGNRYQEMLERLAKIPDNQLRSYCLNPSDSLIVQEVLEYKKTSQYKASS